MDIKQIFKEECWKNLLDKIQNVYHADFSFCIQQKHGAYAHHGDPELGQKVLSDIMKKRNRSSMDWVKDPSSLKKLRKPLDLLGPKELVSEAPRVLKHFMDEKSKYGCGKPFLGLSCQNGFVKTVTKAFH